MLALLLLHANTVVPRKQLVEELWEYSPPTSAVAAVHTYVMQLRRILSGRSRRAAARSGRLVTRDQGYLLQVRPGELDLDVYEERVRSARDALAVNDVASGARQLRQAEAMWRGQLLVDVPTGPLLHAAMERIERQRLDAIIDRIHAELRMCRHHELVGELSALVHRYPTNEDLCSQLMLALYRSGRQADALTSFHQLRYTLRAELGTYPSQRIQQLHTEILSADPQLEPRADTPFSPYLPTPA